MKTENATFRAVSDGFHFCVEFAPCFIFLIAPSADNRVQSSCPSRLFACLLQAVECNPIHEVFCMASNVGSIFFIER